jgi:phosphate:Na+ symporter
MLILFFPFLNLVDFITMKLEGVSPFADAVAIPIALSLFHSMFNITNTFVLVWFIPLIIKIVNFVIKNNPNDDIENFRLKYIDTGLVSTSELGIQSAKQEIEIFGQRVERMFTFVKELDDNTKVDVFEKTMERIKKYETITDKMEIEIAKYLTKITEGELSKQSSQKVASMLRIIDNLESIGDSIYQMAILKSIQREQKIKFDTRMNTELDVMFGLVENSLKVMNKNLQMDYDTIDLEAAYNCENEINTYRNILRTNHLEAIKAGSYTYELGTLYSSIYALYEKTGDFVINVSEAMDNSQKIAEHGI